MKLLIALLSLFLTSTAQACGGWAMLETNSKNSVSFWAESMSIHHGGSTIHQKIRPNSRMAYFSNGDRVYYDKAEITYWKRLPGRKKWAKKAIGSITGQAFEISGLGKFNLSISPEIRHPGGEYSADVNILDESKQIVASAKVQGFCGAGKAQAPREILLGEAKRMISYFVWKKQRPDLAKEIPNWWW